MLDDRTIQQLIDEKDSFVAGRDAEALRWPEEPLRAAMIRSFATLGEGGSPLSSGPSPAAPSVQPFCAEVPNVQLASTVASGPSCPAIGRAALQRAPWRRLARTLPSAPPSSAGIARFAQKYPAVLDALLRTTLEMICKYHKTGQPPAMGRLHG